MFPTLNLVELAKIALRWVLFFILLGIVTTFTNFLIGKIPPVELTGCMGYWADQLGIFYGFRVLLSIVLYGYMFKFGLDYFKRILN